ncbi:MAG: hypothetical protein EBY11_05365 [Proteobacteria bacterium]|nr:hypothetical protein [Pseudomonadota bacterium]
MEPSGGLKAAKAGGGGVARQAPPRGHLGMPFSSVSNPDPLADEHFMRLALLSEGVGFEPTRL